MPFSSDLDDFLAKLQIRVDAVVGEAREELKEMVIEAEKDWSELRQYFHDTCCEPAKAAEAAETPETPETESTSHSETSTEGGSERHPG